MMGTQQTRYGCALAIAFGLAVALNGAPVRAAGEAAKPQAALVALRIVPERATLWGARAAQRFVVVGTFADGLERDVTGQSHFTVSDPRLVSLDPAGRLAARADGELELKAELGTHAVRARVRVEGSA